MHQIYKIIIDLFHIVLIILILFLFIRKFYFIKKKWINALACLVEKRQDFLVFRYNIIWKSISYKIKIFKKIPFLFAKRYDSFLAYYLFGIFFDTKNEDSFIPRISVSYLNIGDNIDVIIYKDVLYVQTKFFKERNIPTRQI